MSKPVLYVVAGPTASGKTAVSIELAKKINGEIISADSMQIYKFMNIGTAKPTKAEMDGVPHHLIDVVTPAEPFSVAEYTRLAAVAICEIQSRNRVPILAGGTGFYINGVIFGTEFTETEKGLHEKDNTLRDFYFKLAKERGADFLHKKLQEIDAVSAKNIHPNNIKRVARALSFCETTGELFSAHNAKQKLSRVERTERAKFETSFNILTMPREILYNRINIRAETMWEEGLPLEVAGLIKNGYDSRLAPMQGIGYKETIEYLNGVLTKEEAIAQIQQATRNYAKRQETWFRHQTKNARLINAHNKTAAQTAKEIIAVNEAFL
jgi:tRNA dimethylallyltransferase